MFIYFSLHIVSFFCNSLPYITDVLFHNVQNFEYIVAFFGANSLFFTLSGFILSSESKWNNDRSSMKQLQLLCLNCSALMESQVGLEMKMKIDNKNTV